MIGRERREVNAQSPACFNLLPNLFSTFRNCSSEHVVGAACNEKRPPANWLLRHGSRLEEEVQAYMIRVLRVATEGRSTDVSRVSAGPGRLPVDWLLAARGRSLIGRVAGAAGPDTRRGEAGDAQASSRSCNKADGCAPPATRRAPGVCRRRTVLLVVDDALPSPPRRALPADARSLAHGLSGLLPRAARSQLPPEKGWFSAPGQPWFRDRGRDRESCRRPTAVPSRECYG